VLCVFARNVCSPSNSTFIRKNKSLLRYSSDISTDLVNQQTSIMKYKRLKLYECVNRKYRVSIFSANEISVPCNIV
jgi:hypothetical protein